MLRYPLLDSLPWSLPPLLTPPPLNWSKWPTPFNQSIIHSRHAEPNPSPLGSASQHSAWSWVLCTFLAVPQSRRDRERGTERWRRLLVKQSDLAPGIRPGNKPNDKKDMESKREYRVSRVSNCVGGVPWVLLHPPIGSAVPWSKEATHEVLQCSPLRDCP